MRRVFKFGGALLKDARGMQQMTSIIAKYQHEPLVVVVSAIGKTTNALEKLLFLAQQKRQTALEESFLSLKKIHFQLAEELPLRNRKPLNNTLESLFSALWKTLQKLPANRYRAYDAVVGFGELFSGSIAEHRLQAAGISVKHVDARQLLMTDENFTRAGIQWDFTEKIIASRLLPVLDKGYIILTEGFIAAGAKGHPTTLGREGSDFSAAVLAYGIRAREVCIWKNVPGLMNGDPKVFPDAVKLPHVSYNEAIELAFYGASVIHPKTIQPLRKMNIPLKVCAFDDPDTSPTQIDASENNDADIPKIILKQNQTLLSISSRDLSFMAENNLKTVFSAFSRHKTHINLMQNSAVSFSVCFDQNREKLQAVINALQDEFVLKYNEGLQLLTLRHDKGAWFEKLTKNKTVFIRQQNRTTIQVLMR